MLIKASCQNVTNPYTKSRLCTYSVSEGWQAAKCGEKIE
jgi:hypothetical protein